MYFSRPDSVWAGRNVHHVRQQLGAALAGESPVDADVVIPVPDSSIPAAIGYSRASRLIEAMAAAGIVGAYKGSQAREAQITVEEWDARRDALTVQWITGR